MTAGRQCEAPGCSVTVPRAGFCRSHPPTEVILVCGPPCAGKTSYVTEHAEQGDLIVDFDAIATALYGDHDRTLSAAQIGYVAEARDALLTRLAQRRAGPEPTRAWVISSAPRATDRRSYQQIYGARVVLIEASADECKARLLARPAGRDVEHTMTVIDQWWKDYS